MARPSADPGDNVRRAVLEATRRIVAALSVAEAMAQCAASVRALLGAVVAEVHLAEARAVSKDPASESADPNALSWLETEIYGESGSRVGTLRIAQRPGSAFSESDAETAADLAEALAIAARNEARVQASSDALRRREDILAIVAHDLRNPLNTISMSLALLRQDATPRDTPQLDRIGRAMHRMNRLIGDLLDAAALDEGRLKVTPRPEFAAGIAREAADAAALTSKALRSRIELELPEPDVRISADRERLLQALAAILGNALKFTPEEGTVRLAISLQGDDAVFAVADRGPGIDPAHVKRVFERHYKANPASRDGAGLGLFIARGIVEGHRGAIRIDSEPGQGTTVSLAIPLAR